MKTILITGATGFVGRQVVKLLSEQDVRLILVVRPNKQQDFEDQKNVEKLLVSEDLFSESLTWWAEACKEVDVVLHLAWYAEPGKYLQAVENMTCLTGTLTLAQGATLAGVERFVGVGTCFEYDLTKGVLDVNTPLNPKSLYAAAKVASYYQLEQWFKLQQVEFAWCRLFYMYGEGEDERRLVPYIRAQLEAQKPVLLSEGKQIRDFMDIKQVALKLVQVTLGSMQGAFNICTGEPITVRQLAKRIAEEYGREDLLEFGARPDNLIDPPCVLGIPNI